MAGYGGVGGDGIDRKMDREMDGRTDGYTEIK
jgi:hypothetical protein